MTDPQVLTRITHIETIVEQRFKDNETKINQKMNEFVEQFTITSRELNDMKNTIEQRVKNIEDKFNQVYRFATRMDNMFKTFETNDDNIKSEVANGFQQTDQAQRDTTTTMSTEVMQIRNEIATGYKNCGVSSIEEVCKGAQNTFTRLEALATKVQSDN